MIRMSPLTGAPLALGLLSCCAAPRDVAMMPPSSPDDARRQMAQMEDSIRENRLALGLPPSRSLEAFAREESPVKESPAKVTPQAGQMSGEADGGKAPEPPPPAPAAPMEEHRVSKTESSSGGGWRRSSCSRSCRYTQAICKASHNICSLANYLGEADARSRCRRAQQDCRDARAATPRCDGC